MNTLFIGKIFYRMPVVDSTNDWLTARLVENPPEGMVVVADDQTAGKGQSGNRWWGEPGQNLTLSFLLHPRFLVPREIFYLNKLVSVALQKVIAAMLPDAEVHIKWPNDLLVNRRKVAGMLTENQFSGTKVKSSVIGIGVNINQQLFPEESYGRATSLAVVAERSFDRDEVMEKLLQAIEAEYLALKAGRRDALDRSYLGNLWGYQEKIRMRIDGEEQSVVLVGVDAVGQLAVEMEGKLRYFQVKEVEFLFE